MATQQRYIFAVGHPQTVAPDGAAPVMMTPDGKMWDQNLEQVLFATFGNPPITSMVPAGSAVALANNVTANITSIIVPAGTWMLNSTVNFVFAGVTISRIQSGPSVVSATLPTQPGGAGLGTDALANLPLIMTLFSDTQNQDKGGVALTVTSPTTVYLTARASFTLGAVTAYGTISARRT